MRGQRWLIIASLALALFAAGCQGTSSRQSLASAEPGLVTGDSGTTIVEAPPPRTVTFVDRHPLFSKPREYYENSGNNKVVKTAAAAVVGVPVGIYGELKQIVLGAPVETR